MYKLKQQTHLPPSPHFLKEVTDRDDDYNCARYSAVLVGGRERDFMTWRGGVPGQIPKIIPAASPGGQNINKKKHVNYRKRKCLFSYT